MRSREFVTEKKNRRKRKVKASAYGPGPYGWYGYDSGYSGDGGGDGGGVAEGSGIDQEAGIGVDGKSFKFKIRDLITLADNYPITNIDPQQFSKQIAGRDEDPTQSMARAEKADLQYPIIVVKRKNGQLWIADGTHRAHKAILNKIPKIKAKIIPIKDMAPFAEKQGVAEDLSDDLSEIYLDDVGNFYALHPDANEGESVAILIKGVGLNEFDDLWTALPMDYLNQFGGDLPLWRLEDLALYPNIKVEEMTFDQYVQLVGNYIRSDDMANTALTKMKQGLAEGANSITYRQQKGKNKFSVEMLVNGKSAGIFQYDADTGRTITELDAEFRGQGLGQRLILKGIYTAAMLGLDYVEDESRTEMFDRALDSLADAGYVVNDDERWYVTDSGEKFLKQGVAEAWSEKYKKSINCSRPRGFSQRAHCQGRKKK